MPKSAKKPLYVVVRTYSAGVHIGELVARREREVDLANARRIWCWEGAKTLHEIANHGVGAGSKVSEAVAAITLTEAIEVITCSTAGEKSLRSVEWAG